MASEAGSASFVAPTRYIDSQHPSIVSAVSAVAPAQLRHNERAVRIHDFVRDEIKFGFASAFYEQTASQVLARGVGFCNTKGTLFTAMLRAAGIPARQHFVNIDAAILVPFVDTGSSFVDHSYTELWLDGRWVRVDSYIVDAPLFGVASKRVREQSKTLGFGVHRDGTCQWDGRSDAFAQYVVPGSDGPLSTRDYGVHADVGAFYETGLGVNRLGPLLRLGFGFYARTANRRIEAARQAA
jgi:transglutaminase-like putative cysteine protease